MSRGNPNRRGKGKPKTDKQRASDHFDVPVGEVTDEMMEKLPPRGTRLENEEDE